MSYSAQDVIDLSELADLIYAKIDTILELKDLSQSYREKLVRQLSDTYSNRACSKYNSVYAAS